MGVCAAAVLAVLPLHVYYSQEVRMYELVTLWCIASVYCFVRLINAPDRNAWIAYILVSAAALYTQYYTAFVLAFQAIFILATQARKRLVLRFWLLTGISIAFLYLPWIIYAGSKLYTYVTFKVGHEAYPVQDPFSFLARHMVAFSIGHVSALPLLGWAAILFVVLSIFGMYVLFHLRVSASPRLPFPALLISLYLAVPLVLGYLVNLFYPFHPTRYERLLLLASPAFYLLIAFGIAALNRRLFTFLALASLTVVSAFSLVNFYGVARYPNDDYRPLIAQIQTQAQPGDNFLAIYPWQIGYLESYYAGAPLNIIETPNDDWTNNPSKMQQDVNGLVAKNPRVWIPALQRLGHIVEDALDNDLRPRTYSVVDTWFGTTRLELFQAAEDPPRASWVLPLYYVELPNWGVSTNSVVSGRDIIRIWLDWGNNTTQRKLSLRLVDERGNIWAQDDRAAEPGIQRIGFAIPAGTPPVQYDLRVVLYGNESTIPIAIGRVNVQSNEQPNLAAIPHRIEIDFGNGIRLLGYDATDKPLKPGFASGVTFFWQTTNKQNANYGAEIFLQDTLGKVYLHQAGESTLGLYSSSRWHNNELIRDPQTLTLPVELSDGIYFLAVGLVEATTGTRVGNPVRLMQVQVERRPHYFGAPLPSHQADARFGDVARLVGYDAVRSGQNLRVVLFWQALARSEISYKVFMHILDSTGELRAQRDQIPGAGEFPTTTWVKGEYLVDVYDITLPTELGDFQIRVGLYDPTGGTRLIVLDQSGRQIGDNLILKP